MNLPHLKNRTNYNLVALSNFQAQIKEDYKNEIESKNKAAELIKEDKKKKLRYR